MGIPMYAADFEGQYDWTQVGFLSAINAALAVNERDNASVAAFGEVVSGAFTDAGAGEVNVASTAHGLTTDDFVTITPNITNKNCLFTTANGGAAVNVYFANHGLVTGDWVVITGTDDYNGTEQITRVDANNFTFVDTFVSPQRGNWRAFDYSGTYQITTVDADNFKFTATYVVDMTDDWRAYKTAIWSPDDGTAAAIIRFRTNGTENDQFAIEMYAAKGADYYTHVATITCDQGTQDWSSGHFVDVLTLTNENWQHGIRVDSVTDEIGRVIFNTAGYDRFLFISPDMLDDDIETVYIDIVRLDKKVSGDIYSALITMTGGVTVDLSDVVSAVHNEGDNQVTEISDAASQIKSAVDDTTTAVTGVRSGILSAATEEQSILHSILDDTSALADTAVTIANNADSIVDAVDEVRSGILSAATKEQSILHSILDDTSAVINHLDSTVDAVDEVKAEVSDAISNLKSAQAVELDRPSSSGECQKITLNAGAGQGSSQACRMCWIKPNPTNTAVVRVNIGAAADANDIPLDVNWSPPIGINNTNLLYFSSTDTDAIVYILWRN